MFNVPIEDSLAAGDMNNDLSMIEAAGVGIAMKNAMPKLKEMADIVTDEDNDHDGLVKILEHFM
jgi:hydroxymethylpyrimidine pyrophosphatase-like HAD family hydrolase